MSYTQDSHWGKKPLDLFPGLHLDYCFGIFRRIFYRNNEAYKENKLSAGAKTIFTIITTIKVCFIEFDDQVVN